MSALLAVNWQWELRGTLIVIIALVVLPGSIYLILGTNLGARLGFLVVLAGLAGWMFIMGATWWAYGKGLLGQDASWKAVGGQTVIRDSGKLYETGILGQPFTPSGAASDDAGKVTSLLEQNHWKKLDPALPSFQQAGSAGSTLLIESKAFASGEFTVVNVYDKGGARHPVFWGGRLDQLAFWHDPHYSLVEVAPLVPQRTEPGRAPARPVIDTTRPHEFVYMIRDLGYKRRPAAIICISSLVIFLLLCWLLHRRERYVHDNRAAKALPAKA